MDKNCPHSNWLCAKELKAAPLSSSRRREALYHQKKCPVIIITHLGLQWNTRDSHEAIFEQCLHCQWLDLYTHNNISHQMAYGSDDRIRLGTGNSVRHLIKSGSCDLDTSMCHTRYIQNAIGFHFLFSITKPVPPQPKTMTDPPQL